MKIRKPILYNIPIFTLSLLISACVPLPHKETRVLVISIALTENGQPAEGIEVYLSHAGMPDHICADPIYFGTTQKDGHLLIPAKQEWDLLYDIINGMDRIIQPNDLCFKINNRYIYGDRIYSRIDIIEHVTESCRLDNLSSVIYGSIQQQDQEQLSKRVCK